MSAVYQLPDGTDARLTERVMLDWLRRRYTTVHGNGPRWVYATHVPDAPGFAARRTADAVAMDMWNSKGLELHGHEVKVSRSDWLRELREPEKATAVGRYCDRWWLVVPDLAIVKPGELPDDWGLLLCTSAGVQAVEPARKRIPVPVDKGFMAAMARAVAKTASYYVAPEPSGDTVQARDVAALLRFAAAGRREYAKNAPAGQAAALESSAATFDQAARIASGDVNSLRFAVPSWRWDEADALLGNVVTAAPDEELPHA